MLQIRLLGQFDVRLDGKRVAIASRAGQSLFAYLALTAGTAHRREKLAGTIWPESSDENARKNLRQELWRIRKAIPTEQDYLLAEEFTVAFSRESDYWLDVAILERPDIDPQALISSLSLYQGELLPGFYEDWIVLERERIRTLYESKMERLVEQLVDAEHWTAVQEQCERWLALGYASETAYRALMLSYSARGDMAKVSSTYQRCVDDLQNQFGVEPSAETHALYKGLLKGAKAPRRVVPTQPSGTVTFLFTDIESSTRLLDKLGEQYAASLADHHKILRAAIQKWNGSEIDTQGDAFFVTFTRALDAVQCAAEAQRALAGHAWPLDEPLRVRMGLHTCEPLIASTGYVGMDVHRAARIGDASHGGQVLLSQTTRELVIRDLPQGIRIRDLGEHRLKDMKYPTPIYQLVIDSLPADFPAIKTKFTGAEAPTPGDPPFKGLQYFDEADSDLFYGRELLTAKLVNRLANTQFLSVIIGASGSGKSSLVRAGLIPALKKGDVLLDGTKLPKSSADWLIHVITPTAHPLEALATELTRHSESVTAAAALMDDLSKDPRSLSLFLARKNHKHHTLLVVDQFEELFTLCHDEFEREAFIDSLLTAISPSPSKKGSRAGGRITLILTLRADFYAHLAQYPELREAVAQQQEYIGPMTTEELRRAIEEPAKHGHWEFEPGLVDLILRDVGDEPGALPLLSHALLEAWKRRAGHTLTLKGYADAGGVHGAIAHTAQSVYDDLSFDEQTIARNLFLRLTELGEGTEDTRRRASFEELMFSAKDRDRIRAVLNILAEARLVTLAENTAEVAHEALIREWPTLREWLNEDREGLRLHRHLTEAAYEWELFGRDTGALYRGAHLAQAREWAASHPNALNTGERAFLNASIHQEQREEREHQEQQRRELEAAQKLADTEKARAEEQAHAANRLRIRNRVITAIGAVAVVLAVIAGVFTREARTQQRIATSRELAAAAISNLEVDPERSILLALEAVSVTYSADKTWTVEAEDALHRTLLASRVELSLRGHTDPVWAVAFSPDGTQLATASDDGTAIVWDAASGEALLTISTYANRGRHGLAFSPDGKSISTASENGTAKVWDAATGQEILTLRGHTDWVSSVAFSPDGSGLATASEDRTAKLWDVVTGKELLTLSGHTHAVWTVVFSPDGRHLATTSEDSTAKIWDVTTGKEILMLRGHTGPVNGFAFSPDGSRVATSSDDNTAKIWDRATGEELFTLLGHSDTVSRVAFSPDGRRLATTSFDRKVKVWDTATGQELFTLVGHSDVVIGVAFSPDCVDESAALIHQCGTRLATGSWDGTARIWNTSLSRELFAFTVPNARSSALSPDCEDPVQSEESCTMRLATGFSDGSLKLWDVSNVTDMRAEISKVLLTLKGHTDSVNWLAFSPDGKHLASASEDQTVKIWDAATGKEQLTLQGHTAGVVFVAFNPTGMSLATTSEDHTVKVWDAVTAQPVLTLSSSLESPWVAFSHDGKNLATAHVNGTAKIWDATTGVELLTIRGHASEVWAVAFSPDGMSLATASQDGTAKVWDAITGELLLTLTGHAGSVNHVAFNLDGARLVTAGEDGIVKVWDPNTSQPLLNLTGHLGPIKNVAFNPGGTRLFTASSDGTVILYELQIENLTKLARKRVTRSLTTEECQQYLHMEQCPVSVLSLIQTPTAATTMTAPAPALATENKVCEVTDVRGVNDQFYNQMAYAGIQQSAKKFGWEGVLLESKKPVDYEPNVNEFLKSNCDLIVIPHGPLFEDIIKAAATANPSQKFIMAELAYNPPLENVRSQLYAADQAAFLAGYAAASITKTSKVATFGGAKFPAVTDFMNGFALGVAYYNEKHGKQVEVLGWDVARQDGLFTGNFDRTDDGRRIGEDLLNEGADIILPVAGRVGLGTAALAQEHDNAYLIGVDSDWAETYPEYADIMLTSIEKRLDVSVVFTVQSIVDGTFTGGTHIGTLETGEVGLAPFYKFDSLISNEVKADLEQIKQDIIAGKIKAKP